MFSTGQHGYLRRSVCIKLNDRNGVLFYLAISDRKFAIIGDAGINAKVPEGFWDEIRELLEKHFREEKFTEGLVEGILMAGITA